MDVSKFINDLDEIFAAKEIEKAEHYLIENLKQANIEGDKSACFTILNEMMGYYRDTSQYDKSLKSCHDCLKLMKDMKIEGTVDYATALQNIANAYRAAGKLDDSLETYREALSIYEKNISPDDFRMASINNNIALLYQEKKDYINAVAHLKMALLIIEQIPNANIEIAVTCSNLGASLIELGQVDEALKFLNKSLAIFRQDSVKDFHYSAALSAIASAQCRLGEYMAAAKLYEEALEEIRINMGKGQAYKITEDNLKKVYEKMGVKTNLNCEKIPETGLELSKYFYEKYGRDMIHNKFPEYENKIAVGLVGEGSERFGFDDEYSRDHDFSVGFCMWVSSSTYEKIGKELQKEYERLIEESAEKENADANISNYRTGRALGRTGVQKIGGFYKKYTGYEFPPETVGEWADIEDYKLATVTNGEVFIDNEDKFTNIRNDFLAMPEKVRQLKIARELAAMAQTGQYNYGRSMARKDYVTADICISEFMQNTMKCVYLLNKKYAPYYKWMLKGMNNLEILPEIGDILRALADMYDQRDAWENYEYDNISINQNDMKALTVEMIAKLIINEISNQDIIREEQIQSNFLNDCAVVIMQNIQERQLTREELIKQIALMEFQAFDKVENKGGRADCQNNFQTFTIMRTSQYMTWTDEMLRCMHKYLIDNNKSGRNIITEKYARMMEFTSPDEYKEFKDMLPEKLQQTKDIVNQIVEIQVRWMEEFAKEYPKLAGNARDIRSENDNLYNTSYETYLRGELLTYSEELLKLYGEFIISLASQNKNLSKMTIENTVNLMGYESLEKAEKES